MTLNLKPAERQVAKLMQDTCVIVRDAENRGDDVFDESTGLYTRPAGDDNEVYAGKCLVTPTPLGGRPVEGGVTPNPGEREYRALIPRTAPPIPTGSTFIVTASVLDPQLVDATFTVIGSTLSTMSVCRQIDLRRPR